MSMFVVANVGDAALTVPSGSVNSGGTLTTGGYTFVNNTTGGPITLTLSANMTPFVLIKDVAGNAQTNNVTITYSGGIDGSTSTVLTENYQAVWLGWNGSGYSNLGDLPLTQYEINATSARTTVGSGFLIDTANATFTGTFPSNETIFSHAIGSGSGAAPIYDGLTIVFNNAAGQTVNLANGLGIYMVNDGGSNSTFPVPTVLNFVGINRNNNSSLWGINGILTDAYGQVTGSGTGRFLFNELDFNICNPATQGTVLQIGIGGTVQSTSGVNGIGFLSNTPGTISFSGSLITSQDGVGITFLDVGAQATGTLVSSQNSNYHWTDGSAVRQTTTLSAAQSGFQISTTGIGNAGYMKVPDGSGFIVGTGVVASALGTTAFLAPQTSYVSVQIGNSTGTITLEGPTTSTNSITGTLATNSPSYQNPLTGATIAMAAGSGALCVDPAGTLATLSIKLPPSPVQGQLVKIGFTKAITALTVTDSTGSGGVLGAPTAATASQIYSFTRNGSNWTFG